MAPTVEAVILDMDGLMLDTEPLYKVAWQAASAELGYTLDDISYARLVGRQTHDCERELIEHFGSAFPLDRFRQRWPELWRAEVDAHGVRQKPGLLEFLALVEKERLRVGVATSSETDYTAFSLRQAGLEGRFNVIVTGDDVARGKPAPDIYLEAARRLQVAPEACVALEDSDAGVLAASRAGMRALLIPDWTRPSDVAVQAAFRVLASLEEACDVVAGLVAQARSKQSASEYELVSPADSAVWAAYHDIRRRVLFEARGRIGVYDEHRPDETAPGHHSKVLSYRGEVVGVVRVDIAGSTAMLRRVAIRGDVQRRGHGRVLLALAEQFAQTHGCRELVSHVAPDAAGFYAKCGFSVAKERDLSEGDSIVMRKLA